MIVERNFGFIAAYKFEPVLTTVPVEFRPEFHKTLCLGLDSHERLERMLELVVEFGAVECIGAEIAQTYAGKPVHIRLCRSETALIISLDRLIVGIQAPVSIAAETV